MQCELLCGREGFVEVPLPLSRKFAVQRAAKASLAETFVGFAIGSLKTFRMNLAFSGDKANNFKTYFLRKVD